MSMEGNVNREQTKALAVVAEITDALALCGAMPCVPLIEEDDGLWTLRVTFHPRSTEEALQGLELVTALQRVQDIAQIRGFAQIYGIDPARLEALFDRTDDEAVVPCSAAPDRYRRRPSRQ